MPARSAGRSAIAPRARLSLESLDTRLAPADLPPQIVGFTAEEVGAGMYMLYGTVLDECPEGLIVYFTGSSQSIDGQVAVVQADGSFGLFVEVANHELDYGLVRVQVADAAGQWSDAVDQLLAPAPGA